MSLARGWPRLSVALAVLAISCTRPAAPPPAPAAAALPRANVLLVTIDTLRADRVGAYGGPAGLTPTLDRLAAEGLRGDTVYAHVPLTLPSHAAIMTGAYPHVNGVRLERTLGVVTADHGESLGDHGETDGLFAYEATFRVRRIFAAPDLGPLEISSPGHSDILPSILDLLGIASPTRLVGRSLHADTVGADRADGRPIYFEAVDSNLTRGGAPLSGIVGRTWTYIDLPEAELYDPDADPGERTNIVDPQPQRARELQARLRDWTAEAIPAGSRMDSATAAKLQSLGYVSARDTPRSVFSVADYPKRLLAMSEALNAALADYDSGRAEPALQTFSRVLADRTDFLGARLSAATGLVGTSRAVAAVELLRDAPARDQAAPGWLTRQGQAPAAAGDLEKARALLSVAVENATGDPEPLNELGVLLLRLRRASEARRGFERLLEADPTATGTWYNLGLLEMGANRRVEAAAAFRHAVDVPPGSVDAWRGIGAGLATSDPTHAIEAWQRVVELEPLDFDTLFNPGVLLTETGGPAEARRHLSRFLAEAPRGRYARNLPRVRGMLARMDNPS